MLSDGNHNRADFATDSSAADAPFSAVPRRAVPTTFNPIINDEANILCHIARGDLTLAELAIKYETTVTALCLWLQREDIQQKLSNLTTCGAQLTRVAAVNQLPKAVQAMASQIDGYEFDRGHNLIKPGLAADKVAAQRDANVRKACNLLLRLARFDPARPLYSPRPPRADRANPGEARSTVADGGAVERSETEGALFLPSTSQSDLASLCSAALSAIADSRFAVAASSLLPQQGVVPAQPGEGAPAFSTCSSSRSLSSTSDIPLPTSDIAQGRAPPRAMSWL